VRRVYNEPCKTARARRETGFIFKILEEKSQKYSVFFAKWDNCGTFWREFREKHPPFGAKAYVHREAHYARLLPLNVP
jgi:hypothetical protein